MSTVRKSSAAVVTGLLVAAVAIAGVLSNFASSKPDGLERVAEDSGFAASEKAHAVANGPLAGYELSGVPDWLSGSLAGIFGVLVVAAVGCGLFFVLRPKPSAAAKDGTLRDAGAS